MTTPADPSGQPVPTGEVDYNKDAIRLANIRAQHTEGGPESDVGFLLRKLDEIIEQRDDMQAEAFVATRAADEALRAVGQLERWRDAMLDGNAVFAALSEQAKQRTSAENVADVLDAAANVARAAARTPSGATS